MTVEKVSYSIDRAVWTDGYRLSAVLANFIADEIVICPPAIVGCSVRGELPQSPGAHSSWVCHPVSLPHQVQVAISVQSRVLDCTLCAAGKSVLERHRKQRCRVGLVGTFGSITIAISIGIIVGRIRANQCVSAGHPGYLIPMYFITIGNFIIVGVRFRGVCAVEEFLPGVETILVGIIQIGEMEGITCFQGQIVKIYWV